jgi:ketosteroid isomerase-like protein
LFDSLKLREEEIGMTESIAEGGIAVAREFYDRIGAGGFEDAMKLMDPELVVHEPKELPYGGEYHGVEGFVDLTTRLSALVEVETVTPPTFLGAGDVAVAQMIGRFTSPTTGRSVDTPIVELFSVRNGRIVDLDVYYKDPNAVASVAEG